MRTLIRANSEGDQEMHKLSLRLEKLSETMGSTVSNDLDSAQSLGEEFHQSAMSSLDLLRQYFGTNENESTDETNFHNRNHEIQYSFNSKLLENLKDIKCLVEQRQLKKSVKALRAIIAEIKERNEIICLVDRNWLEWSMDDEPETTNLISGTSKYSEEENK